MTALPKWITDLDSGIAAYVVILDAFGVETFESCEAGKGHCFSEPTVRFYGHHSEGFRALAAALTHGLPVRAIRRYWTVDATGEPTGPNWEMTFFRTSAEPVQEVCERMAAYHQWAVPPPGLRRSGVRAR